MTQRKKGANKLTQTYMPPSESTNMVYAERIFDGMAAQLGHKLNFDSI